MFVYAVEHTGYDGRITKFGIYSTSELAAARFEQLEKLYENSNILDTNNLKVEMYELDYNIND